MTTTTIKWITRFVDTKEPIMRYTNEHDAVEFAAKINKKYNAERIEVVKQTITVETL